MKKNNIKVGKIEDIKEKKESSQVENRATKEDKGIGKRSTKKK